MVLVALAATLLMLCTQPRRLKSRRVSNHRLRLGSVSCLALLQSKLTLAVRLLRRLTTATQSMLIKTKIISRETKATWAIWTTRMNLARSFTNWSPELIWVSIVSLPTRRLSLVQCFHRRKVLPSLRKARAQLQISKLGIL